MQSDIETFAAGVRTAVSTAHTVIVDGFPADARMAIRVDLDPDELLRLLSVVKPKLLYLQEGWFDCARSIDDYSAELGAENVDEIDISPLSGLRGYGKEHDGKLCLVYVAFVFENVLHLCLEEAEWYESFQAEASELLDRLKAVLSENRKNSDMKSALEIKRKAGILVRDPAFNYNRPSREKRTYLAEQLFPDSEWQEIGRVVDEATNIDYLEKARSSDN